MVTQTDKISKSKRPQPPGAAAKRLRSVTKNYELYLFILPAAVVLFLFTYIPMYGLQIAFKDFVPAKGIWDSAWVGFKHFNTFFHSYQFWTLLKNTLSLSVYSLAASFPIPIIFALILNQMRYKRFKRVLQTITYMPHFISMVVIVGMIQLFLSPTSGLYANLAQTLGWDVENYLGSASAFPHLYVWSGVWQSTGWSSIIYLAALASVDPTFYEAATVDGANQWHKIIYIDIPSILPTAIILLIMNAGSIMSVGFEKIYLMQNPLNSATSEVIATYVYKIGIISTQYSLSAAVGMFNTIINFILLVSVNWFSKRVSGNGLW